MTPENIYYIFNTKPHEKGHVERVLLGKFSLDNGKFEILEDHGLPLGLAQLPPAEAAAQIHRLTSSMYFEVINAQDLINGLHPELIKDADEKEVLEDDIKTVIGKGINSKDSNTDFEYDRVGGEGPRTLSVSDGQVFLDGHLLGGDEVKRVQEHVQSGKAYLRNKMKKAEDNTDHRMDKLLHEDSSVPGVGNLKAYNTFLKENHPGMHIHLNGHDVKDINNTHGHEVGHRAIRAIGAAAKHIAQTLIGQDAKVFRIGGDKFSVHVPSTEGAALFARGLRQHLEATPPVRGTHNFAVSMGIGPNKDYAQWALLDSVTKKNQAGYKPGQSKTHISIKVPGALDGHLD